MIKEESGFKISYALSLALQLGFLIASSIVGFLGIGLWLDSVFETGPTFLLLGLVLGVVTSVYESYSLMKPFTKVKNKK
ncbi:MAG: AtpZ/AtpI family protein [Candidatus Paceibacterota bacterium]